MVTCGVEILEDINMEKIDFITREGITKLPSNIVDTTKVVHHKAYCNYFGKCDWKSKQKRK
jgi:hypothetical protein